jgi:ESF2/ABP1 family protein
MAEPTERDQFTDEEEDDFLEDGVQGLGSEGEEEGGEGAQGKWKPLGNSLGGIGKRGVCYLSRVPPHMNPSHIRQMLSKYGEVLRIYLVPEGNQPPGFDARALFCLGEDSQLQSVGKILLRGSFHRLM